MLKARDIARSLLRKGFREDRSGDHRRFAHVHEGRLTGVETMISHGEGEVGAPLVAAMSRQLRLSKKEFRSLVGCSLSGDGYVALLRDRDVI